MLTLWTGCNFAIQIDLEHGKTFNKLKLRFINEFLHFWTWNSVHIFGISPRTLCQNFRTIGIKVPEKSKISDPPFLLAHAVHLQRIESSFSLRYRIISSCPANTRSTRNIHTFLAPLAPVLFEIHLRDSDRMIFQTILNEINSVSNFINLNFLIRIFCNKA